MSMLDTVCEKRDEIYAIARKHKAEKLWVFGSNPPSSWPPIIRRATSSIPDNRHPSVESPACAIRYRNRKRRAAVPVAVSVAALLLAGVGCFFWHSLCENVKTNLVVQELAWECLVTNKIVNSHIVLPERAYRNVQKTVDAVLARLNCGTNEFSKPMLLDSSVT